VNVLGGSLPRILRWNGREELPLIRLGRGFQYCFQIFPGRSGASPYTDKQELIPTGRVSSAPAVRFGNAQKRLPYGPGACNAALLL
jgi:hypothetical protein